MSDDQITVAQLQQRWGCCRAFIDKLRMRGDLPFARTGRAVRLRLADVEAFELRHRRIDVPAHPEPVTSEREKEGLA